MGAETAKPTRKAASFGVVRFDGSAITCTSQPDTVYLPLSELAVVGEFTTDSGPYTDDYFLVLVSHRDGRWLEMSMYEEGGILLKQLSRALDVPLQVSLFRSTQFASRIIWPVALAGRRLFTFERVTAASFLHRLKLLIVPELSRRLSPDVLSVIERNS